MSVDLGKEPEFETLNIQTGDDHMKKAFNKNATLKKQLNSIRNEGGSTRRNAFQNNTFFSNLKTRKIIFDKKQEGALDHVF